MKARFQASIPTTDLADSPMMYDIADYLQSTGSQIRPEILDQVVEDLYKIVPPFFLKGSKSKAGQVLSSRPMKWDAREYDILGLTLYCVISPNKIFIFSSEPIQSERDLYNILAADPDFFSEFDDEDYEDEMDEDYQYEENPPMTMAPWVQWAMWGLHTAGMFLSNPPPRITEELVGHHHGQNDLILNAYGPESNQLLGYISYSEFPAGSNKIQVNWMYVSGAMRRRGIGTLLVLALQDKYKKINWGFTTPEGTGLLKKIEALKSQKMAFLPGGKPNRPRRRSTNPSKIDRAAIARIANERTTGPEYHGSIPPLLSKGSDLNTLETWLQTVDPNGCHTKELAKAEGFSRYTLKAAWEAVFNILSNT